MKNYFEMQKLQLLQEDKLDGKIGKINNADENLKNYKLLLRLAIAFFVMNLIIITISVACEYMIVDMISSRINVVIIIFSALSLISLISSMVYKNKLIEQIDDYYKKYH